ncbi:putative tRNA pseudouridine synthase Pus10, partial [Lunasporangiospora selenospora]
MDSAHLKRESDQAGNLPKKLKQDTDQTHDLTARLERALSSREKKYINALLSIPCCGRCALRFLGIRDFGVYELAPCEIRNVLLRHCTDAADTDTGSQIDTTGLDKRTDFDPKSFCTVCVGTVQFAEGFVEEIVARMRQEGFVTNSFNMNVTLPTSTLIRNHAVGIYLHQQLGPIPMEQVDIKEVFKLLISWPIEAQTGLKLDFSSVLRMQVVVKHDETKDGHIFLSTMKESGMVIKTKRESRKMITVGDGRPHIVKALSSVSKERFTEVGNVPPTQTSTKPELDSIEMTRESVYVGGRYLKFSRDVSQTPWSIGTTVLAELSVSGIVCEPIKKAFRADDFKFVTAGREDANVRMLGNGRPFYMELINPRIPELSVETIQQVETEINAIMPEKVQIQKLTSITCEDTKVIKEGEETKTKSYSALCWASNPVDSTMIDAVNQFTDKSFIVEQQTPIRVLQ